MRRAKAGLLALLFAVCVLALLVFKSNMVTEEIDLVQEPIRTVGVRILDLSNARVARNSSARGARNSSARGEPATTALDRHADDSSSVESPHEQVQRIESAVESPDQQLQSTDLNRHADSSSIESPHEQLQRVESESLVNQKNDEIDEEKILQAEERSPVNLPGNKENAPPVNDFPFPFRVTIGPPLQLKHNERQEAVVNAFKHAWMGYTEYAWGKDELLPITKSGTNSYGMGMTIIDSLDTMWLMGLTEEFKKARDWVADKLNIAGNHRMVSLFETNIRVMGGLLAAYHLSNDKIFLQKAVQLGDAMLPAFKTSSGIPYGSVTLNQDPPLRGSRTACVAEMGTLQLEFRDLSHSTGDTKYQEAVDKALNSFQSHLPNGIAPQEVDVNTGTPRHTQLTVGGRTDSYYEYLIKQWIQSGKKEEKFRSWYSTSASAIITKFVKFSHPHHMPFLAELHSPGGGSYGTKMEHLACFVPGMLALGYFHGFPRNHLNVAENLTHTCYEMYHRSPSGLSPDSVAFNQNKFSTSDFHSSSSVNLLRPETVESLFVLYRVTKDQRYRDWGWEILQAFERHSRVESGGYTTLTNVNTPHPPHANKMESFFLAETLKYLFLLFTDDADILPLDKWVFNTEAHPLPVWTS